MLAAMIAECTCGTAWSGYMGYKPGPHHETVCPLSVESTRYVVFNADWQEPPGTVVKVFSTREEAQEYCWGPGDGYGYSIVEVPAPEDSGT